MYYLAAKGWKETLPKRDVTGEVDIERDDGCTVFALPGHRDADMSPDITFTKAQAIVLPENMTWEEWLNKHYRINPCVLEDVLSKHTTTVIQVWKEVE